MLIYFNQTMMATGFAIETVGVIVIITGLIVSIVKLAKTYRLITPSESYKVFRQNVGRSIILGLEFLIAGDIIRTVAVGDSLEQVATLALIIIIRAFLSMTLHLDIEGHWPWQKERRAVNNE